MTSTILNRLGSWEAFCDKVAKDCADPSPRFKKWLMSKESLGGPLFDSFTYRRAYFITNRLEKDFDHVSVIVGYEGKGKSTLGINFCSVISPSFAFKYIAYSLKNIIDLMSDCQAGDSILCDEGILFSFSREALSQNNKIIVKILTLSRQLNIHIAIAIPNLWLVDSMIRDHRMSTLIYVSDRGKHIIYTDKAIPIILLQGKDLKRIQGIKVPYGNFADGYFTKAIATQNDLNIENYKIFKRKNFEELLKQTRDELNATTEDSKFVKGSTIANEIGMDINTFGDFLRKGKIPEATKMGDHWYIPRDIYSKIIKGNWDFTHKQDEKDAQVSNSDTRGGKSN